ncbi:Histone H2B, partial [Aphis craccivora]
MHHGIALDLHEFARPFPKFVRHRFARKTQFSMSGARETTGFPPSCPWKIEFSGQTGAIQISGTVVRIHANYVLNIGVKNLENLKWVGFGKPGDLLVELQRHSQDSTLLVEAISKVMENSRAVKALEKMEKIAILDMDEQVEEDDIVASLGATYGISAAAIKVESLLSVSRGQKIGFVKVPIAMVAKVLDVGRLRVGYTNCRIRIWEKRKRCGNDDHKAVVCKFSRNKCEEFGIITKLRQAKPSIVEADQSILEDIERDPGRKDDIRQHD